MICIRLAARRTSPVSWGIKEISVKKTSKGERMRTVRMQEEPGTHHTAGSALDLRRVAVEFPPTLAAHNSLMSHSTVSVNQAAP